MPNFSKVAKPLIKLLQNLEGLQTRKRNSKYIGDKNSRRPLRLYKGSALKFLYWHMQTLNLLFILHTDVSGDGLGAV